MAIFQVIFMRGRSTLLKEACNNACTVAKVGVSQAKRQSIVHTEPLFLSSPPPTQISVEISSIWLIALVRQLITSRMLAMLILSSLTEHCTQV